MPGGKWYLELFGIVHILHFINVTCFLFLKTKPKCLELQKLNFESEQHHHSLDNTTIMEEWFISVGYKFKLSVEGFM